MKFSIFATFTITVGRYIFDLRKSDNFISDVAKQIIHMKELNENIQSNYIFYEGYGLKRYY